MNFPPFWARGASGDFSCWRWSSNSVAEAQSLANEAAQQLAERFAHGDFPPKHGGYYPNRPFREPVLQEIKNDAGETAAVVTRNSYGCLVLNTARVMFVDVDLPEPKSAGLFNRLFGKPAAAPVVTAGRRHREGRKLDAEQSRLGLADLPDARRSAAAGHARAVRSRSRRDATACLTRWAPTRFTASCARRRNVTARA